MIGKLIGLATVGSTLAGVGLLHRFLSGIASVVMMAIVSAFMVCMMLAGGFYLIYYYLVRYGLDPYAAGLTVGFIALVVTITFVVLTILQVRQLRELHHRSLPQNMMPDVGGLVDAFVEGLLSSRR